ncbi:hypothetical protein [Sinobacterium caligoides]|nr:hypothetical protein [Sinobacterium caligoides]
MSLSAEELEHYVIRPTLSALDVESEGAVKLLLGTAALESHFSLSHSHHSMPDGLGLFQITPQAHREVWDNYLAFRPNLASKVRGLASQHHFLTSPDIELRTNLSYSTAIAWMIYQYHNETNNLPIDEDVSSMGELWAQLFEHGPLQDKTTFINCYRRLVGETRRPIKQPIKASSERRK